MVGKHLKCVTDDPVMLVAFLKEASLDELIVSQSIFAEWNGRPGIPFPPTLEIQDVRNPEPFMPDTPRNLLKAGEFHQVPLMLTANQDEGSFFRAASIIRDPELLKELNENWNNIDPSTFLILDHPALQGRDLTEIVLKIRKFYFDSQEITLEKEPELTNLYSDSKFLYGIHETAIAVSKYAPVYTGLITHVRKDFSILWSQGVTENLGVITHAEELPYLYDPGNPECPVASIMSPAGAIVEPGDIKFSKGLVRTISSFVKTGIPELKLGNCPKWIPVTKEEAEAGQLNWLSLNLQPKLLVTPFKERMTFWDSIYKTKP